MTTELPMGPAARATTVLVASIVTGAVYGVAATIAAGVAAFGVFLILGAVLGLTTAIYTVPLLTSTRLERSLPLTMGLPLPILIAGVMVVSPFPGVVFALQAQIALAIASNVLFRTKSNRPPWRCTGCGYDTRGIAADAPCPECGAPRPR